MVPPKAPADESLVLGLKEVKDFHVGFMQHAVIS
jgi:hypothetical protein